MFSKLAFKNVGRSMKDYGVWFLTIAFGIGLVILARWTGLY